MGLRFAPLGWIAGLAAAWVLCACAGPRPRVDPIEPVNRSAHALDRITFPYLVDPASAGLDAVLGGAPQQGIGNLFHNLSTPKLLVSDLAQARVHDAGEDLLRFVLNATLGLAGWFDFASTLGIERNDEDLGQAFCAWGIPLGPYVYFPLLGPSSATEAVSITLDTALAPVDSLLPYLARQSARTRLRRRIRAAYDEDSGVDRYVHERVSYLTNRARQARDEPFQPVPHEALHAAPHGTCGYRS